MPAKLIHASDRNAADVSRATVIVADAVARQRLAPDARRGARQGRGSAACENRVAEEKHQEDEWIEVRSYDSANQLRQLIPHARMA